MFVMRLRKTLQEAEILQGQKHQKLSSNQCCGAGPFLTGSGFFSPARASLKRRLSAIIFFTTSHLPYKKKKFKFFLV